MKQDTLSAALQNPFAQPVYYLASQDAALLRERETEIVAALAAADDADVSYIDGPAPDMGDVIGAAGAISFFGTPRVVVLRAVSPTTMGDKDIKELAELFGQLEKAVLVVTSLMRDKKAAAGKKAKALLQAAGAAGFAMELSPPTRRDNLDMLHAAAAALGASFAPGAAEALLERVGEDRVLLRGETEKLAAASGYAAITQEAVKALSAASIEADVFELSRLICAGRKAESFQKLADLFALRHEPIAISAALAGSFVDMLRTRYGKAAGRGTAQVFKELGYKGSDWRLKKAAENAAGYSTPALEDCILCLEKLDAALKSSALSDKSILLQAAVGELLELRG